MTFLYFLILWTSQVHLKQIVEVLAKNGLFLNKAKCFFLKTKVDFSGHTVEVEGVDVVESKVVKIKNLPLRNTRKELKIIKNLFLK